MKELAWARFGARKFKAPFSGLIAIADGNRLAALEFAEHEDRTMEMIHKRFGEIRFKKEFDPAGALSALSAYFEGNWAPIKKVGLSLGGTDFQRKVWMALRSCPMGKTMSYGEEAKRIGAPKAARAVGAANGKNPCVIAVPCHRAIGADGALVGFAGGLETKAWLLRHEGSWSPKGK